MKNRFIAVALTCALAFTSVFAQSSDPLPSWNAGGTKQAITSFVAKLTRAGTPDFVAPAERIATFDNDGTLWAEQPLYFQLLFAVARIQALAPQHPEWKDQEPFKAVLAGDINQALAGGERALLEILAATHAGMTTEEFAAIVEQWLATAKHPTTGRRYTEMAYQPMIELLAIGSTGKLEFELRDGKPALVKLPAIEFIDDKDAKPIAIHRSIGRRPIAAFGNSDGDLAMLQWTCAGKGARLCGYVHHTDAEREWAYDRKSSIGRLDKGLDEAKARSWTVIDMKQDWNTIYPPATK
jgi:hypothetical protein